MMHVVFVMANNSSAPYFNWFAEEAFHRKDIRFTFIALHSSRPAMIDEMKRFGWECIWIPFNNERRKRDWFRALFKLYRVFRKLKPDVVHTHLFDDSLPSMYAAKWAGIKVRAVTKGDTTFHWYYAPKAVFLDRLINKKATHIIAISEECKEFILEKERAEASKVKMIHHGIPIQKRLASINEESRRSLSVRFGFDDRLVIGTVARLIEWKGYRYIIEAAREIVKANENVLFTFVGSGNQKEELTALINEYGLERHIIFTGWVDPSEVPSLFSLFDIYLHAASFEPFGFVIAEAMAHSLPVVATKSGAARDAIIHKENGYLVAEKNPGEIVEGLQWMLDNDRNAIGARAFHTAVNLYDFRIMYDNYLKLYQAALT